MKKILLTMMAAGLITTGFAGDNYSITFGVTGHEEAHLINLPEDDESNVITAVNIDLTKATKDVSDIDLGHCIYHDSDGVEETWTARASFSSTDDGGTASNIANLYESVTNLSCVEVESAAQMVAASAIGQGELDGLKDGTEAPTGSFMLNLKTDDGDVLYGALKSTDDDTLNVKIFKGETAFTNGS